MISTSNRIRILAAALMALPALGIAAGKVTQISPSAQNVALKGGKAMVKFTVSGEAAAGDDCGYFVEYGDGLAGDSRIVNDKEGRFPRSHERTFTKPGNYVVRAKGQRVKTTFGCDGDVTTLVVVAAGAAAPEKSAAAAAPNCPSGWELDARSVHAATGAYDCTAKPPAKKLACAPGLKYYEKAGTIGCRKG